MPPLSVDAVRRLATKHGYEEVQHNELSRVVAFRKNLTYGGSSRSCRVNVYYTTGTVATCLDHPVSGKTQLFRRDRTEADLDAIFRDPRGHTGAGYYRRRNREAWSSAGAQQSIGSRGPECDDAKRWRYAHAATGFCNDSQANQIAAICKLWNQLRFMPGGLTEKERYERYSEKEKALYGRSNFCTDSEDCKCSERAGSWCSLIMVLAVVAYDTDNVVGYLKRSDGEEDAIIKGVWEICHCPCEEGTIFRQKYGTMLTKLERQFRSLPQNVRRELIVWFVSKHMNGFVPFSVGDSLEGTKPKLLGEYCSNELLACLREYGDLTNPNPTKGCTCHGI